MSEKIECSIRYDMTVKQDDLDVRGNAFASGNEADDIAAEDAILDLIDKGDVWAWALVSVTATLVGPGGEDIITGAPDHLGGCSYRNEAGFVRDGGYYEDMRAEAYSNLLTAILQAMRHVGAMGAYLTDILENNRDVRVALGRGTQ